MKYFCGIWAVGTGVSSVEVQDEYIFITGNCRNTCTCLAFITYKLDHCNSCSRIIWNELLKNYNIHRIATMRMEDPATLPELKRKMNNPILLVFFHVLVILLMIVKDAQAVIKRLNKIITDKFFQTFYQCNL